MAALADGLQGVQHSRPGFGPPNSELQVSTQSEEERDIQEEAQVELGRSQGQARDV